MTRYTRTSPGQHSWATNRRPSSGRYSISSSGARDAALAQLQRAFETGESLQGWQVDKTARDHITRAGFGGYFGHRLGHSLGREVHGNAVNLDGWETFDTRAVIPGIAVTIEPGIYLPDFGVRSEIDVYISESGPQVTTEVQRDIVPSLKRPLKPTLGRAVASGKELDSAWLGFEPPLSRHLTRAASPSPVSHSL